MFVLKREVQNSDQTHRGGMGMRGVCRNSVKIRTQFRWSSRGDLNVPGTPIEPGGFWVCKDRTHWSHSQWEGYGVCPKGYTS